MIPTRHRPEAEEAVEATETIADPTLPEVEVEVEEEEITTSSQDPRPLIRSSIARLER